MSVLLSVVHSHIFHGALAGAAAAARVDYETFLSWKSFHDAATYNWSTAAWRWFQGAVFGAVVAVGAGQAAPDIASFGS